MSMSPRQPVEEVADGAEVAPASASRRRFVRNVGLGAAALGAVAVTGTSLAGVASAQSEGEGSELDPADVALVQFLQSVSLAAEKGLTLAGDATYLEPELREEVRIYARHHANHAETLGGLLTEEELITDPNARLLDEISGQVSGSADQAVLLDVLLGFEQSVAATLLAGVGEAGSWRVSETIATLQPIVAQQAAALGSANGVAIDEWLPTFATTDGALAPNAYPAR